MTREFEECVIDWELPQQSFFIRKAHRREALRDGPEANPFGSDLLLAFHVGSADDQRQALQPKC